MPRASTSPRCARSAASNWLERPTRRRVAVSSSASESSPGDGFRLGEIEVTVFVLEFMHAKLHRGFPRPVFARSRTIAGRNEIRVDRITKGSCRVAHARRSPLDASVRESQSGTPQERVKREIEKFDASYLHPGVHDERDSRRPCCARALGMSAKFDQAPEWATRPVLATRPRTAAPLTTNAPRTAPRHRAIPRVAPPQPATRSTPAPPNRAPSPPTPPTPRARAPP
jgi:hypothetical protein